MLKNTNSSYGWMMKLLHWVIAALVILQVVFILKNKSFPKGDAGAAVWIMLHKSFGFFIFGLAVLFIAWRLINPKPQWSSSMAPWQQSLARIVHLLLYVFIILMPLSGLLMGFFKGYSLNVFNMFTIPATFLAKSETLATFFYSLHTLSPWLFFTAIALHTLGALIHQYYYKDNVLKRML